MTGKVRYYKEREGQRSRVRNIQEDLRHSDQPSNRECMVF